MGKFEKAVDLYLRGFNSKYIKNRTGISMQSLLKQLLANGIRYTKNDIFEYQINYIQSRFSKDDISNAYIAIIEHYKNPSDAKRGRNITSLGCGFGDYVRVFKYLLGEDEYKQLHNECWHKKQKQTMQSLYGVDNPFRKETFSQFVTEGAIEKGKKKRTETMIERYGVEHPNQNPAISKKMVMHCRETNIKRYGVEHPMQLPDVAFEISRKRQMTMLERYGVKNSVENESIRNSIFEHRRSNGTLNTSKPEEALYEILITLFGEDNVVRNKIIDNRYPFHVDFYIKSLDLFIELNGDKSHGGHWFNPDSKSDLQTLSAWTDNMLRIEKECGKSSRYRKYIKTWTKTDVQKRSVAKSNNLNYLVFWDGSCRQKNKKQIPRLSDAYEWINDGCPMPFDWRKANTY